MAEPQTESHTLVRQIHASGGALVLALTGGGSLAISQLLGVPGASHSVLEALVPYSLPALARLLGGAPDQACSEATARAMAMAAYLRAVSDAPQPAPTLLAGVGLTASLATDRPKLGEHRLHAAWQTAAATGSVSLVLHKGQRSRADEEALTAAIALNVIAESLGLTERLALSLLNGETLDRRLRQAPPAWQDLLAGRTQRLGCLAAEDDAAENEAAKDEAAAAAKPAAPPLLLAGAFNPLHAGHRGMATAAAKRMGSPGTEALPAFEISIQNVDKPPLDFIEIERRLAQFAPNDAVWLTRAPTFVEKARLFPGATFIVGADTIVRIADPKYYADNLAARDAALAAIAEQGCGFLVFGRLTEGSFRPLASLDLPAALRALCIPVEEDEFRSDISSTELRARES